MSNENVLTMPYRSGFQVDDDAHTANVRKMELWARGPKSSWSFVELTELPPTTNFNDGTIVFVNGVLYILQNGVWTSVSIGTSVAGNLYLYEKLV